MYYIWIGNEHHQDVSPYVSDEITDDVGHDDACCSEFDVESLLQADEQDHRHCKDGEEEFIFYAGKSACQCDGSMQKSEDMYDSGYFYVGFHAVAGSIVVRS